MRRMEVNGDDGIFLNDHAEVGLCQPIAIEPELLIHESVLNKYA